MTPEQWAEAYRRLWWKARRDLIETEDLRVFQHAKAVLDKAKVRPTRTYSYKPARRPEARHVR